MNTFTEFNVPKFQAGQVLRHTDLNTLVDYLDNQDRLTRMLLIGIGIVEGLMPRMETGSDGQLSLVVGSGIGISSDGYLIYLDEEWEFINFYPSQITPEEIMGIEEATDAENRPDMVFHLLKADELPDSVEEDMNVTSVQAAAQADSSFTLEAAGVKPLSELPHNNYVLVLYLKENKDGASRCFSDVEDKFTGVKYDLKALLVQRDAYTLCEDAPPPLADEVDQSGVAFDDFTQPYIRRFGYQMDDKIIDLKLINSFDNFFQNYSSISQDAFSVIETAYMNAYDTYRGLLNQSLPNPFAGLSSKLKTLLDTFTNAAPASLDHIGIQYLYDYLRILIAAHNEFLDSAVDLRMGGQILPDSALHPRHVPLGLAVSSDSGIGLNTDQCRAGFRSSAFHEENTGKNRKALFLLDRMKELVKFGMEQSNTTVASATSTPRTVGSLSRGAILSRGVSQTDGNVIHLPVPKFNDEIRITPSRAHSRPLSERAVPYYIDTSIKGKWNFFLQETGRTASILGFHFRTDQPPYDEPLHYEMEAYSFFRVEGHIGMSVSDAYQKLDLQRKQLDLPFDFQFVKLSDTLGALGPQQLLAEDLQAVYALTSQEVRCAFEDFNSTEAEALRRELPSGLMEFNYTRFANAYTAFENSADQNFPEIACRLPVLNSLRQEFAEREGQFHLFPSFSEIHQGLEHTAGVPKGGTLVLVYAEFKEEESTKLKVVGDFSLDYNCCANRGGAVMPETYLAVVPAAYCSDDQGRYELVTYPLGGVLNATIFVGNEQVNPDVGQPFIAFDSATGKYYFHPSGVPMEVYEETGRARIELTYEKYGHVSTSNIAIYQKPDFQFPAEAIASETIIENGRPVSQRATFEIREVVPGENREITWMVAGEPAPGNNKETQFTYDFPYSEGFTYEVRVAVRNGICQTGKANSFTICTEEVELQLPDGASVEQGSDDVIELTALPQNGVFRLIGPDGHVLRPIVSPKDGGEANEYVLSAENLDKVGDYELIYRLPQCLKSARAPFQVSPPPLSLEKYRFCSDDDTEYPIMVVAEEGEFSGAEGVIVQNGQGFFNPTRVSPGEFGDDGVATVTITYTPSGESAISRELTVYQVPEIEIVTRRPIHAAGVVMGNDNACLLRGYEYDFRVRPTIWETYNWKVMETKEEQLDAGTEVSFRLPFRDPESNERRNEYRVRVEASTVAPLNDGDCPSDKTEVVRVLCPDVKVSFDLVAAASADNEDEVRTLILPPPDENVPTFAIEGVSVPILAEPLGGDFRLELLESEGDGEAMPFVNIINDSLCEEEKSEYFLDIREAKIDEGSYRLSYWIRDCVDENGEPLNVHSVDFNLAIRPVPDDAEARGGGGIFDSEPSALPAILENRLNAHHIALEELRNDANVPRSNAFKSTDELLKTENQMAPMLEAFENAAPAAIKKFKDSTGQLQEKYGQLVDIIVLYFLDRLVAINPIQAQDAALELLGSTAGELAEADVGRAELLRRWNGAELKDALGASVVDQITDVITQAD